MDEDDLMSVANEKNILLLLKQLHENFRSETPRLRKLSHFSEMQNDALARGARSARADARLCTSSGINLIVPLSFHLVR